MEHTIQCKNHETCNNSYSWSTYGTDVRWPWPRPVNTEYLCRQCDRVSHLQRDPEYEASNTVYTEEGYRDIKCKNYEMCKGTFDYRMVGSSFGIPGCKNYEYLCINCYIEYGKWKGGKGELRRFDGLECPVCLETKRCIEQPRCEHTVCIDCFVACHHGLFEEPAFPYTDDVKEQYFESEDPESFMERYPLLVEYEAEYDRRSDARDAMAELNGRCPLCRK